MHRLWAHVRRLWPGWTIHFPLLTSYWALLMLALGDLRWDHVAVAVAVVLVGCYRERSKQFLVAFAGYIVAGWLYDASRFFRNLGVTTDRVLLCDLRQAELTLFGVTVDGQRQTLQDYFLAHHHLALDLFCAPPYGLYLLFAALYSVYLFFRKDQRACIRYTWAFGVLNVLGFATYHIVPAAPPWYFHKWGCVVDLAARSFEGQALARADLWLGIGFFHGLYGRASEVFGAIPSLHVAYPLLILIEGWRRHKAPGRAFMVFLFAWMCFAAVYTDHHWVIDLVLGWIYTVAVAIAFRKLLPVDDAPRPPTA